MHQSIMVHTVPLDDQGRPKTDRHGNPLPGESLEYPARVQYKTNEVRSNDGTLHNTDVEIDVPPEAKVRSGMDIFFVDSDGVEGEGIIEAMENAGNIAGNRTYFKVLMVNGK